MPCPNGVNIPLVLGYYNEAVIYSSPSRVRTYYRDPAEIKEEERADKCIKCEQCIEKCPQKLPIPELLEKAHAFLTEKE
jgi:predicted aldo/keto reductase-like oxidoreductase